VEIIAGEQKPEEETKAAIPPVTVEDQFDGNFPVVDAKAAKQADRERTEAKLQMQQDIFKDKANYDVCELPQEPSDDGSFLEGTTRESIEITKQLEDESPPKAVGRVTDLESVPPEDRPYFVKNLDTGDYEDIRVAATRPSKGGKKVRQSVASPSKPKVWGSYWKIVQRNNEKLIIAAEKNDVLGIRDLLDGKLQRFPANANYKAEDDMTPLHAAIKEGNLEAAELLLEFKADIEAKGMLERTPLHIAAFRGNTEAAKILFQYGADKDAQDRDGNTPLHIASEYGTLLPSLLGY
jgi:hypothetical protein